jgi:universal stress protein E
MPSNDRILFIAPPELERTTGLYRAAELAVAGESTLHIAAFEVTDFPAAALIYDRSPAASAKLALEGYLHERQAWLEEAAQSLRRRGLSVTTDVQCTARPREDLMRYIEELRPALVVKDISANWWPLRVRSTSLDAALLRDCPAPLHLITQGARPHPKRILAAVDLSTRQPEAETNARIIQSAARMAAQCEARLELLYAYDAVPELVAEGGLYAEGALAQLPLDEWQLRQQQAFLALAERFGVPPEARHFVPGFAADIITEFAEHNRVDVIVLAKVHRTGLDKWLGSTTESVLRRTDSSILAIRPDAPAPG